MATYPELVQSVIDWSNRDTNVISYNQIKTFINYATDGAYRKLRIAPMEQIVTYTALTKDDEDNFGNLVVPANLIEFIQLRKRNTDKTSNFPVDAYDVYNSKTDINSFYENGYWKWGDDYVYVRERNKLRLFPAKEGDIFELYYYRRFPAPNQTYEINNTNAQNGNLTRVAPTADTLAKDPNFPANGRTLTPDADANEDFIAGTYYATYVPHWLRDENEKVILFGALAEAFDYLDEADQAIKYREKFELEIARLNEEDKMRMGSGGNIQVRYTANGLL